MPPRAQEERKDQAEKDLDKYYDDLTDKKAMKQAQNRAPPAPAAGTASRRGRRARARARRRRRAAGDVPPAGEHEELTKAQTHKDVSNPFERVVDLIGGAADDGAACDKSIFRSLLVRLKNDPKPPARPAAAEAEPAAPEPEAADDPFAAADP